MIHVDKTFLFTFVATAALAACGGPTTPPPDTPTDGDAPTDGAAPEPPATADAPAEGAATGGTAAELVAAKCVACHESPEVGKLTADELGVNLDANHETVEMTPEERQAIVDYLAKP